MYVLRLTATVSDLVFHLLFCRCNNVMYLRGVPEDEDAAEDDD